MRKNNIMALGVLSLIIFLSGCLGPLESHYDWEETVEVLEVKTEIDAEGRLNYYFKSNSTVTSNWINAIYLEPFQPRTRLIINVGDFLIIRWNETRGGMKIANVLIYKEPNTD